MSKPVIKVGVVSDVVCPWCYIGKRRLEKAIESLSSEFDFEVAYYPFELNADMPLEGKNQKQYLTKKFGSQEEYERLTEHVSNVAASEGLEFNYEIQTVSPNTRNLHRMILISKEEGKQLALVEALFKAFFTDGIDLSKKTNLVSIAQRVGLPKEKIEKFLESEAGLTEVAVAETEIKRIGVTGVPFYIINDKYGVSGAQSTETFIEAFRSIGKELMKQGSEGEGEVCEVDSKIC